MGIGYFEDEGREEAYLRIKYALDLAFSRLSDKKVSPLLRSLVSQGVWALVQHLNAQHYVRFLEQEDCEKLVEHVKEKLNTRMRQVDAPMAAYEYLDSIVW